MIYKVLIIKCYNNGAVLHSDNDMDHPDERSSPFACFLYIYIYVCL